MPASHGVHQDDCCGFRSVPFGKQTGGSVWYGPGTAAFPSLAGHRAGHAWVPDELTHDAFFHLRWRMLGLPDVHHATADACSSHPTLRHTESTDRSTPTAAADQMMLFASARWP
ncbi:hypothetical protein Bcep18194_A4060 [Burkholderia lata]|uniref:Uncharacterized protein n=1 Tax=Burkholderia lata (strain ATCC 17760 / DSM 23089 / LMG 22485 / NCIMB 9086 / R18194 / 383) TaxID=482957 RepID=Q39IQ9_BURL3|nr:hypothetical protein Bcep18194_A4060 [Burkholderia lata]